MPSQRVDIRTPGERNAYAAHRDVYVSRVPNDPGFQSTFRVYADRDAALNDAPCGSVGQRDASGTASGYAGWYVSAAPDPVRASGFVRLSPFGTRYHSRRLALRALQDRASAGFGSGTGSSPVPVTGTARTVSGLQPPSRRVCGTCGAYVPDGYVSGVYRGRYLCPRCDAQQRGSVAGYHAWSTGHEHAPLLGDPADPDTFGWELELYNERRAHRADTVARAMRDTFPEGGLYAETDCSIGGYDGFESITAPMSRTWYRDNADRVTAYLQTARVNGMTSHATGTCGLHVHLNRAAFGVTVSERDAALLRFVYVTERFWDPLLELARRTPSGVRSYARAYRSHINNGACPSPADIERYTRDDGAGAKRDCMRMFAVNATNDATVEFRLGRGTLNEATFRAWIDLTWALVTVARSRTVRDIDGHGTLRALFTDAGCMTNDLDAYMISKGM